MSTGDQDGVNECISSSALINEEYNIENSPSDGQTWAYFRITMNAPDPSSYSWDFSISFSGFAAENDIEYSADGSSWADYSEGTIQTVSSDDLEVYVRVLTDASTSSQAITATIADQDLDAFGLTDVTSANDEKTYTIDPIPSISGFSGS